MFQLGIDDIANSLCLWAVKYLPETREFKYTYYIRLSDNLKKLKNSSVSTIFTFKCSVDDPPTQEVLEGYRKNPLNVIKLMSSQSEK